MDTVVTIDYARMAAQLELHEGVKLQAYQDTLENWTVFTGYNLTSRGTDFLKEVCGRAFPHDLSAVHGTAKEARAVLDADIVRVEHAVRVYWPFYDQLDPVRRRVALDMAFNMGFKALGFKKVIAAIERRDYSTAVKEMWNSRWARQVEPHGHYGRCDRLTQMLLTGNDYSH